jgi:hypothetical protein
MRSQSLAVRLSTVAVAAMLAAACAKKEPAPQVGQQAEITEVSLGKRVNTAQQVDQPTQTFTPVDTIFASVKTANTPVGTRITAVWVYTEGGADHVVSQNDLSTTQAGTGYTAFHVINPGPWPAGSYQVRVGLNGQVKETKNFSVRG